MTTALTAPHTAPTADTSSDALADAERWARLAIEAPRYTSYPTAVEMSPAFGADSTAAALRQANEQAADALSLYVHLPFCQALCWFCGCHAMVARTDDRVDRYLGAVERELATVAALLPDRRTASEVHFGGGSPSLLTPAQFDRVWGALAATFRMASGAELSLEIDPRTVDPARMAAYRRAGVQRVSMGFQDLDPSVQAAIGRNQSEAVSRQAFAWARQAGFTGVNVDLCYGLPAQTEAGLERTAREVARLRPDRVALFGYAHVPAMKPLQRRIDAAALPDVALRLRLFRVARQVLLAEGYRAVGIDHFALPGDALVRALDEGRLHRNFQGYTTTVTDTLLGFGLSAISDFGGALAQNQRSLAGYLAATDAGRLATERGFVRTPEDRLRGEIIRQLMCTFALDVPALERRFALTFADRFARELDELRRLGDEGLLSLAPERITLTPAGRLLARNVAVVFDAYRRGRPRLPVVQTGEARRFSPTI